jgi:hypothetical protein
LSFIERRRAQRFELQLPVIVRWSDGNEMREALAVSGDVSSNGIYFVLGESLKEGTPVELEMTLPNQITLAGPVRVCCFGRIQRCELKEGANAGMAAAIEKYQFLRNTGKAPSVESSSLNSEG